jgi:hypothetical protein
MSETRAERWPAWPATVALCAAVVLALCSLRGGFWLDEILAGRSAWTSAGWLAWIEQVHREDPHYLTILWMRLVGRDHSEVLLRAPSIAFALATLLLVHRATREDGPRGQLVAMVIWGCSWLFVCYAGEARGYSGVIFHSLAALLIERRIAVGNTRIATCVLRGLNYAIGLLAQPILLAGVLASAAWLALLVVRRRISWRHAAAVGSGPPWPCLECWASRSGALSPPTDHMRR